MGKWLVRLKGEKFDLEDLPALLQSLELTIIEENGFYYLQSCEFESLTSADEVHKQGTALIKILNGVAKLHRDKFRDVSEDGITCIEDGGSLHHHVHLSGTLTMRAKLSANAIVTTPNGTERVGPSNIETWIGVAKKCKPVADALHFFGEDTWGDLYKVYEIIKDDVVASMPS